MAGSAMRTTTVPTAARAGDSPRFCASATKTAGANSRTGAAVGGLIGLKPDDLLEFLFILGLAVSGQTHHFVLIAISGEAQILAQRRIVDSQRMRKSDGTLNV